MQLKDLVAKPDLPCRRDPTLFDDHRDEEAPAARDLRHRQAIAVCDTCPEKAACLRIRLRDPSLGTGVWGGVLIAPDPRDPNKCPCGVTLFRSSDRSYRVYCSDTCRWAHRYVVKEPRKAECVVCGTAFETSQSHRRFCTDTCRRIENRRNTQERRRARDAAGA